MRIDQVTAFLYALNPQGIRFGLENTRLVLERLDRPQDHFAVAHIAGSNGKGSTAAFLESVLRQSGQRIGLYTSPHLVHFGERFRVDGQRVPDDWIEDAFDQLLVGLELERGEILDWIEQRNLVERMGSASWYQERGEASQFCRLTFFECTTVMAVLIFKRAGVAYAIMETGMGGRLDATNVLSPRVCAITPIHLEHTAWLGDTIQAIAGEKAGIIKSGVPVVCARQQPEARQVIQRTAEEKGAPIGWLGEDFEGTGGWEHARFRLGDRSWGPTRLGLIGRHQVDNAALALACAGHLGPVYDELPSEAVCRGLGAVNWPGRFERFGARGEWVLDGAHNPDGVAVLVDTVRSVFCSTPLSLVFGVLGDKDASRMLEQLLPVASSVHFVRPRDARGRDPRELLPGDFNGPPVRFHASMVEALDSVAKGQDSQAGQAVLITGSLTIIGEARSWLLDRGLGPTPAAD